ncbi:hypothetical protein ASF83_13115 [Plantibacter sp. Leaf171]|uniref:hypothetical protein n=1 Tax=unclassified Plantibacter TaxID=2624265 RepID=UPI0006F4FD26|nr:MULTISPECIES: hypothetical protein [unclassified Plantibacter]KQM16714.1 hypothetical protein ASE44_13125 [Plantibacter sp. Leaf1]KQR59850.1 hypothetical protein ASF83_13115 [Plantibacter sp. Leaf171]
MTAEELFADEHSEYPRQARSFVHVGGGVAALVAGGAAVVALLWLLVGSFQGTFFDVSTCGYAATRSTCQDELRERVRTTLHIPLSDDVRVAQLHKHGFPDPIYEASLIFPSAREAAAQGYNIEESFSDGTVSVKVSSRL